MAVIRYDLSLRKNLIRLIDNLIGIAKCYVGLAYSLTAEDVINEALYIIDKFETKTYDDSIDVKRLQRIGINIDETKADMAPVFLHNNY